MRCETPSRGRSMYGDPAGKVSALIGMGRPDRLRWRLRQKCSRRSTSAEKRLETTGRFYWTSWKKPNSTR